MNWLDAVYIVILLATALVGLWKGLLKLVFAFVAVILGIILGGYAGDALASVFGGGWVAITVCSVILAIIISLLIYFILTRFVRRFIMWAPMFWIDRLGGIAVGVAVGFTICGAISALLGIVVTWSLPLLGSAQASINNALHGSALEPAVRGYFDWILAILPAQLDRVRHFLAG
jgi:uncharacterized membrane protein required for colicin V production